MPCYYCQALLLLYMGNGMTGGQPTPRMTVFENALKRGRKLIQQPRFIEGNWLNVSRVFKRGRALSHAAPGSNPQAAETAGKTPRLYPGRAAGVRGSEKRTQRKKERERKGRKGTMQESALLTDPTPCLKPGRALVALSPFVSVVLVSVWCHHW